MGMVPATVMYVYIGSVATDLATLDMSNQLTPPETQIVQWIIRGIGLITTVTVTLYVTHLAKKALNESVVTEEIIDVNTRNR